MTTVSKKIANKTMRKKQINFGAIFEKAAAEEYTREDTVAFIKKLLNPILKQNVTSILNKDALSALEDNLKGNMALHMSTISMEEVIKPSPSVAKKEKRFDYVSAEKEIVTLLKENSKPMTFSEIRASLEERDIYLTSNRWAFLRSKHMPNSEMGKRYTIRRVKGTSKRLSKWELITKK